MMSSFVGVDLHRNNFTYCIRENGEEKKIGKCEFIDLKGFASLLGKNTVMAVEATGNRNAFSMCPWKHLREVVAMLKAIHAQEAKAAARQKAALVSEKLRAMKLERIASFVENSVEETLSYMDFPYEHWSRLRTNNGFERIMKEIRRRTRVVGSFPDGYSAMMLVGARLRHISTTKWGTRQYMNTCKLYEGGIR